MDADGAVVDRFLDVAVVKPTVFHRDSTLEQAEPIRAQHDAALRESLPCAAALGDVGAVTRLLATDPEAATRKAGPREWPPILYACFSFYLLEDASRHTDFAGVVRTLLDHGADANSCFFDDSHEPPERESAMYGALGMAHAAAVGEVLLQAGADPNDNEVAYHCIETDNHDPLRTWLAAGPTEEHRLTALGHKLDWDDHVGVKLLLEAGTDPNGMMMWGVRALHQAIRRRRSLQIIRLLVHFGADPGLPNKNGQSAYALAVRLGWREAATLLETPALTESLTPIDQYVGACSRGDAEAAAAVRERHADVRETMAQADYLAMVEAAQEGHEKAVALMLAEGWPLLEDAPIASPLHRAAMNGHRAIAEMLVRAGADPAKRDPVPYGPVWGHAEHGGHPELAQWLAQQALPYSLPAAIFLRDASRMQALLAERPERANEDDRGTRPLHIAVGRDYLDGTQILLDAGADPAQPHRDGRTLLQLAEQYASPDVIALIQSTNK